MAGRALRILEGIFRANPQYELVLFDRLDEEHRQALSDLRKDPELYGILRPRGTSDLSIKAVDRDTALLYLTLVQPGPLPAYVRANLRSKQDDVVHSVAQLVLDGVLEIEDEGVFLSGISASARIFANRDSITAGGRLARLSIDALKYGQTSAIRNIETLSARLYFFNRLPVSPSWRRRFPTPSVVEEHLGVNAGGPNDKILRSNWTVVPKPPTYDGWIVWESRREQLDYREDDLVYKLYVSPDSQYVREVFGTSVHVLTRMRAPSMKVGGDVYGLLRPDKIVAYFWSLDQLRITADLLRDELGNCPAHGVPFTAELASDGLLSWGIDPPRTQQILRWRERESWRLWVTNRLASALVTAKAEKSGEIEPWEFALERLQMDGVDTTTWSPTEALWRGESRVGRI